MAEANALLNQGDYAAAGAAYAQLAQAAEAGAARRYQGLAALAYQDAGDHATADALLGAGTDTADLRDPVITTAKACSMLASGFNEDAYALAEATDATALTPYQRGRHARCLGAAAAATNHPETAATAWVAAWRYPFPSDQREAGIAATWQAVSRLPEAALTTLNTDANSASAGWYGLGLIALRSLFDPPRFAELTSAWQQQYPGHPATAVIETLVERAEAMSVRPRRIALLLPFDATLGAAASAVRDGFMTAWYQDPQVAGRPEVRIYSTAEVKLADLVQTALADGAEFIVGPLRKNLVDELRRLDNLQVPALALNVGEQDQAVNRPGFFQFGLTPEDEAAEVARHAITDRKHALVLAPRSAWGQRLADAYATSWQALGGEVVARIEYGEQSQSYAEAVKRALNIDLSEARHAALRRTLNLPLQFQPRRRTDVDLILLAAFPSHARQILPQLRYFRADKIPVFATSHVYAGGTVIRSDIDLDGITFADMPWLFGAADSASFNVVRRSWPQRAASFARLYGLGVDAYRLLPYLARMRYQQDLRIPGVTGELSMDRNGTIHRRMTWLKFVNGVPTLLDWGGSGHAE